MYDTEAPPRPSLAPEAFERVSQALRSDGPLPATEKLLAELREAGDLDSYFYALLMKKRLELGVSPFPAGSAAEVPESAHEEYEDAIRDAGRTVGRIYLGDGRIAKAWVYFRMLGEPGPVREAIDAFEPDPAADCEEVIQIAFHQGVHPEKGFDLILDRYGICSAITMVSGMDFGQQSDLHAHCVRGLVRSLHEQLIERLRAEVIGRGEDAPESATVRDLIAGRDWLFEDNAYHIDVSHLSSVAQMALRLPACPELRTARELCAYGEKLGGIYRGEGDPPFEDTYADYGVYLEVLAGENVDAGLAHFRAKAEAAAEEGYAFPAEVLVNLMVRSGRPGEAIEVSRKYLLDADERELSCPGIYELCHQANDYKALAEVARQRGEGVPFLAALVRGRG